MGKRIANWVLSAKTRIVWSGITTVLVGVIIIGYQRLRLQLPPASIDQTVGAAHFRGYPLTTDTYFFWILMLLPLMTGGGLFIVRHVRHIYDS